MVRRGQVWTLLHGGAQRRILIISNDEYNAVDGLPIWALTITRDAPVPTHLAVQIPAGNPLAGAYVRIHGVVQVVDRTALREGHGYLSHEAMTAVEEALREFLELP